MDAMPKRVAALLTFAFATIVGPSLAWASATLQSFSVVSSKPASANNLFSSVGPQGSANVQYAAAVWPVSVNFTLLNTSPLNVVVNFPDRASVTLVRDSIQQSSAGGFVWNGRGGDCTAFLRLATVGFLGHLGCNNAVYSVSTAPSGSSLQLVRVIPASGTNTPDIAGLPPGAAVQNQMSLAPAAQVDTTIDVLVLYSSAVRSYKDPGGGNAATVQLARDAVAQTQSAMKNSVYPEK